MQQRYQIIGITLAAVIAVAGLVAAFTLHAYADSLHAQSATLSAQVQATQDAQDEMNNLRDRLRGDAKNLIDMCGRDRSQIILFDLLNHLGPGIMVNSPQGGTNPTAVVSAPQASTTRPLPGATPNPLTTPNPITYLDVARMPVSITGRLNDLALTVHQLSSTKAVVGGNISGIQRTQAGDLIQTTFDLSVEQPTQNLCHQARILLAPVKARHGASSVAARRPRTVPAVARSPHAVAPVMPSVWKRTTNVAPRVTVSRPSPAPHIARVMPKPTLAKAPRAQVHIQHPHASLPHAKQSMAAPVIPLSAPTPQGVK